MDHEQRLELQKLYEQLADEKIRELVSLDKDEFEEEALMLLESEARRRNISCNFFKEPQEIPVDPDMKVVEVYQAKNLFEADFIRMLLEKDTIECTYSEFPLSSIQPVAMSFSDDYALISIQVCEDDVVKAMVLLDTYIASKSQRKTTLSDGSEIFYCTECFKPISSDDEVCPPCGEKFEDADTFYCSECFKPIKTEDDICPSCGLKIE